MTRTIVKTTRAARTSGNENERVIRTRIEG